MAHHTGNKGGYCRDSPVRCCRDLAAHAGVQLHDAATRSTIDFAIAHIGVGILANYASRYEHDLRHSTGTMTDGALWLVSVCIGPILDCSPGVMRCARHRVARFLVLQFQIKLIVCRRAHGR